LADYNNNIKAVKEIVKGNLSSVNQFLKDLMKQYADAYDFENAQLIKEKIDTVEKYQSKTAIVNPDINNVDVYTLVDNDELACVNFMKVVNGSIIQSHTVEVFKRLDEANTEILEYCIIDIRQRMNSTATEVLVPIDINIDLKGVKFFIPQRGDKLKLLELSERNAKYVLLERMKTRSIDKYKKKVDDLLYKAQYDLRLKQIPMHIECFDNSNLQGTNAVAACVVFKNGKPSKSDYRHFNIKTVEGPNDFASMEEIVYRRYKRLIDENADLPQLIIIDGGKGQLSSATRILTELNLIHKIAIIGIAKRLEEIFFPDDPVPVYLDKNSSTLRLIQNLRNEAHRFGITFHRQKRSNAFVVSELDSINGVGEKVKELLFNTFKNIDAIKKAPVEELEQVIGKAKAKLVFEYFKK
jgi:excinuclease ABC subunit C